MTDAKVDWYEEDVVLAVEGASDEFLTEIAFWVEGEAKADPATPVDTGFMRNAIYGLGPKGSHRSQAQAEARAAADRPFTQRPNVPEGEAAVHGAAEYTIYQEMARSFMYRALERAQQVTGGIVERVGKRHL